MSLLLLPDIEKITKSKSVPPPDRKNNGRSHTMTSFSTTQLRKIRHKRTPTGMSKKRHSEKIPRKLGPRDIGKISYKGTKYEEKETGYWLDEKIHRHARTSSFNARKRANPLAPKAGFDGSPQNWDKPSYYKEEIAKMRKHRSVEFLQDKPLKPHDRRLKALKNVKIPKGQKVGDLHEPFGWTPISYKFSNSQNSGDFLEPKFWFEASKVSDAGLAQLIESLPAHKKMQLSAMAAPTGYQSKINYLKKLRELVMTEIQRIHQEDNKKGGARPRNLSTVHEHEHNGNTSKKSTESDEHEDHEDHEDLKVIDMLATEINNEFEKDVEQAMKDVFEDEKPLPPPTNVMAFPALLPPQQKSLLGDEQREVFSMKSLNRLNGMIENIEHKQKNTVNEYALKN